MMRLLTFFLMISFFPAGASAQRTDSTFSERTTTDEQIAVWTTTGIIIPLALAGTALSVLPPSLSMVIKDGTSYGGLSIETGAGIGSFRETGIYSDWRIAAVYTFIISSSIDNIARLELKHDMHFDFVDRRRIFLSGLNFSAGVLTDFPNTGYTAGAGVWLKTPWLNYFGFFPQHTFGFTYRYNRFFNGKDFHELSAGITSSFTY